MRIWVTYLDTRKQNLKRLLIRRKKIVNDISRKLIFNTLIAFTAMIVDRDYSDGIASVYIILYTSIIYHKYKCTYIILRTRNT